MRRWRLTTDDPGATARLDPDAQPLRALGSTGLASLTAIALGWLLGRIPTVVAIAYGALSLIAFVLYGIDKSAAVNHRWRIRESSLHLVGLLGGWPGALVAQDVFRHKCSKTVFRSVFWATVGLNCALMAWLLVSGGFT